MRIDILIFLMGIGALSYLGSWIYAFYIMGKVNGWWMTWQILSVVLTIGSSFLLTRLEKARWRRRDYLEAITNHSGKEPGLEPLQAYSEGLLSRKEAIRILGLRGHSELLVALGKADLPMPTPPAHEVEQQARLFEQIWKNS